MERSCTVPAGGPRLLAEALAAAGAVAPGALIEAGSVYADGRRVAASERSVAAGVRLTWDDDGPRAAAGGEAILAATPPVEVYRDRWLLVVDKPAGVPTQATRQAFRGTLEAWLLRHEPHAAFHHRLDREARGLVAVALDPGANEGLARAFSSREATRTYRVDVAGVPVADGGVWRHALVERRGVREARPEGEAGERMESTWRVSSRGTWSRLEVSLRTGRTHQVRLQAAAVGLPVVGDLRYGRGAVPGGLHLQAARLELRHPVSNRALCLELPEPADWGPPPPLVHVTTTATWEAARHGGALLPDGPPGAGFVHLSRPEQLPATVARHFRSVPSLVVLRVDPAGLDIRWEEGEPGELFPHLYGPLPVSSVVAAERLGG